MWAKTLTTAILLVAGGLTAVCAGWSVLGLYEGMNVQEIMNPVSYVDSEQAQRYVRQEVYSQLDNFASENKILNGIAYNGDLTVDISNLDGGVKAETKDPNLEYKLSDLDAFYNSDGYPFLRWLTETKDEYVYDEYEENDVVDSEDDESSVAATEAQTESAVDGSQPVNIETVDISDWISESDDGGTADNRHPEAYESYQVKCYNNGPDVLYGNGLEIEQKFIKNINGMTLADYARTSDQMNLLSTYYDNLLDAARQVHALVEQSQNIEKQFANTNVYVYLVNEEDGSVFTNVPAWKTEQAMSLTQVEEQYLTEDYSAPDQIFYLMIDEAAGKVSTPVHYMNEEMKEIVSDVLGDGNWKIFVGLDTNYHCKTSPSYFDSMFYAFYKNTSEQLTFQGASGEKQINVFAAMWVFLALAIVMLVLVALQTGRKPEDDKIHPVLMDRFPIELLMLKDIILWTLLVVLYGTGFACVSRNSSYYYSMLPQVTENVMVRCAICGVLATALFAWNLKSYGRRIKECKLGGSILASIAHAIKKNCGCIQKNHSEFLSCTEKQIDSF